LNVGIPAHDFKPLSTYSVSDSGTAKERYAAALAEFRDVVGNLQDTEDHEGPLTH